MRKPLIIANWKMNHTIQEGIKFVSLLKNCNIDYNAVDVVLCPPFTSLSSISIAVSEENRPKLGGQNCHFETHGAYTGEVSPVFLKELNCEFVLVGHSERRSLFGETDNLIGKKMKAALEQDLTPVFCIGETLEERKKQKTMQVIKKQIKEGLEPVPAGHFSRIVVAYEPVWAIGTGLNATPDEAQEVHAAIRKEMGLIIGSETAERLRILYGGSVKPDNASALMEKRDVDGLLVGGASLTVDSFYEIVNYQSVK